MPWGFLVWQLLLVAAAAAVFAVRTLLMARTMRKTITQRRKLMAICPGASSPGCKCTGTCRFPVTPPSRGCSCPVCHVVSRPNSAVVNGALGGGGSASAGGLPGYRATPLSTQLARLTRTGRAGRAGMPGFGEQEFPFAAGSVNGLRIWQMPSPPLHQNPHRVLDWRPSLTGATGFVWASAHQEAFCKYVPDRHQPPVEFDETDGSECGCGFWAYWDIAHAGAMMSANSGSLPVAGIIKGTGRVLIGERGFRSQRADIIALAPAFSIQVQGGGYPYSSPIRTRPVPGIEDSVELAEARQNADAWLGVIQAALEDGYPGAKVYATVNGMLASVQLGEII